MRKAAFFSILLCLTVASFSFPFSRNTAFAQPSSPVRPPPPPDAATLIARAKFSEALKLTQQGRWQEAYPLLAEAWKNKQHWQIALHLARAEVEVEKYTDAIEHLTFVRAAPDTPDDGRKEAALLLEQARGKLGHLRIDGTPPGAQVVVDGVLVGTLPLSVPVDVNPGPHVVELRLAERRMNDRAEAKSGEITPVTLNLRIFEASPPPSPPPKALPPPPPPSDEPRLDLVLVLCGPGVAAVGGIVGGVLYAQGQSSGDRAAQVLAETKRETLVRPGCSSTGCRAVDSLLGSQDVAQNAAVGVWIGSGIVTAGLIAAGLLLPKPPGTTSWTIAPSVDRSTAGVTLQGKW